MREPRPPRNPARSQKQQAKIPSDAPLLLVALQAAAHGGARADPPLSDDFVGAGRTSLPAPADLLALRRPGAGALWALGRRLDDAGAAAQMSPVRDVGYRQRSRRASGQSPLVPAVALRQMVVATARCAITMVGEKGCAGSRSPGDASRTSEASGAGITHATGAASDLKLHGSELQIGGTF